jgi:hypothetical protein
MPTSCKKKGSKYQLEDTVVDIPNLKEGKQ